MIETNIIEYITKNTDLRQTDLADKLGISRAQISKWKAGEYIPSGRRETLMQLAGLFGDDPDWAIFAKTEANAKEWIKYFEYLNDLVGSDNRASYHLVDMAEIYVPQIMSTFNEIGINIPSLAPSIDSDQEDREDPFEDFVFEYLRHYGVLVDWCVHYARFEETELIDFWGELESYAQEISLFSVEKTVLETNGVDLSLFESFEGGIRRKAKSMIKRYCIIMQEMGVPYRTDYFDILHKHVGIIDEELESIEWSMDTSVDCYLPYGERMVLQETRKTNALLEELMERIDRLARDSHA